MHGPNGGVLLSILSAGMNERFAGSACATAHGEGSYLAEDAGKCDQYVKIDESFNPRSELHKRLYGQPRAGPAKFDPDTGKPLHPGDVFYILVCRVALGHYVRAKDGNADSTSVDTGESVFASAGNRGAGNRRELSTVAGVPVPVHHHSFLVDAYLRNMRYREFIIFHSDLMYPEYVIAYTRHDGDRKVK